MQIQGRIHSQGVRTGRFLALLASACGLIGLAGPDRLQAAEAELVFLVEGDDGSTVEQVRQVDLVSVTEASVKVIETRIDDGNIIQYPRIYPRESIKEIRYDSALTEDYDKRLAAAEGDATALVALVSWVQRKGMKVDTRPLLVQALSAEPTSAAAWDALRQQGLYWNGKDVIPLAEYLQRCGLVRRHGRVITTAMLADIKKAEDVHAAWKLRYQQLQALGELIVAKKKQLIAGQRALHSKRQQLATQEQGVGRLQADMAAYRDYFLATKVAFEEAEANLAAAGAVRDVQQVDDGAVRPRARDATVAARAEYLVREAQYAKALAKWNQLEQDLKQAQAKVASLASWCDKAEAQETALLSEISRFERDMEEVRADIGPEPTRPAELLPEVPQPSIDSVELDKQLMKVVDWATVSLFSQDGQFLGNLDEATWSPMSIRHITAAHGVAGGRLSVVGGKAPFGAIIGRQSARDPEAQRPPVLVAGGQVLCYVTANADLTPRLPVAALLRLPALLRQPGGRSERK